MSKFAPIAVFVYNRPEHTRRMLEALAANALAQDSDLYIYSDGARSDDQASSVEAVRDIIRNVSGFMSVTVIEQKENLGLAASIIMGVSDLCEREGRVIVLEDDLITAPQFIEFMNAALDHYVDDDTVMQVSGHSFLDSADPGLCVVLPMTTSWGWGTWKRAWRYFDAEASGYANLKQDRQMRRHFDADGAYPYFAILERHVKGEINSWAILWYLSVFMRGGTVVYPPTTLVQNSGFDGSGTHCRDAGQTDTIAAFKPVQIGRFPNSEITLGGLVAFSAAMRSNRDQVTHPGMFTRAKQLLKSAMHGAGMLKK